MDVGGSDTRGSAWGGRAPDRWRIAVVAALVVSVATALAMWSAVARLDDAHDRAVIARRDIVDVESMLRARLDEALGRIGLDGSAPTDDARLEERLSLMADDADDPGETRRVADDLLAREAELRDDASADGGADERLVAGVELRLRGLERAVVDPAVADANAAATAPRRTIAIGMVVTTVLWLVALWLARAARAHEANPGR